MKEPAATSPFAALTRQEQKERWICWQCQRPAEMPEEEKPMKQTKAPLPTLKLPTLSAPREEAVQKAADTRETVRHGQYDAVVSRLRLAQRKVGRFQQWS